MLALIQAIPFCFAALFPVLNPIGSSVVFLDLIEGATPAQTNKLAMQVALNTAVMLIVVLFLGSWILRLFGISVPIVLIGGGLVLAYIGWQMLNQPAEVSSATRVVNGDTKEFNQMGFFPLTMPVTAGPGVIAVTITIGAHSMTALDWQDKLLGELGNTIAIILVSLVVFFCYRYTQVIIRHLGKSGAQVIMRLAAFVNLCIGLEIMWHGVGMLLLHS